MTFLSPDRASPVPSAPDLVPRQRRHARAGRGGLRPTRTALPGAIPALASGRPSSAPITNADAPHVPRRERDGHGRPGGVRTVTVEAISVTTTTSGERDFTYQTNVTVCERRCHETAGARHSPRGRHRARPRRQPDALLILLAVTLLATVQSEAPQRAGAQARDGVSRRPRPGSTTTSRRSSTIRRTTSHHVHPGEATRQEPGGTQVPAGSVWSYDLAWTYPNGSDTWRQLANGYEYSLQIAAPSAGSKVIQIVATGRKSGSASDLRTVEALVRPSSLADFYRVVNGNVAWGSGATTNGKIYANGNIDHDGIATANIYAEGSVTGSYTLQNGAAGLQLVEHPDGDQEPDQLQRLPHLVRRHPAGLPARRHLPERPDEGRVEARLPVRRHGRDPVVPADRRKATWPTSPRPAAASTTLHSSVERSDLLGSDGDRLGPGQRPRRRWRRTTTS